MRTNQKIDQGPSTQIAALELLGRNKNLNKPLGNTEVHRDRRQRVRVNAGHRAGIRSEFPARRYQTRLQPIVTVVCGTPEACWNLKTFTS